MTWLLLVAVAYLLGSVPTGLLVARYFGGADPRTAGSGNIGATNVGRTLGRLPGVLTLGGDALKGLLPTACAAAAFDSPWAVATVGLAAFLGHLFPIFIGFRGGKGVATGLGVFLVLAPLPLVAAAAVFGGVVRVWRMVSLGSLSAAAALVLLCLLTGRPAAVSLTAAAVFVLTVWKHWGNVERILQGTERRVGGGR